jgi:hypothetical protein
MVQRFLRSVSGDGTGRHRHLPAHTGPDWTGPAQDRPGLSYEVFDKNFVLNSPNRHDILKILIKIVIKQPGPVGAGLVPVQSGQCRSVSVPVVPGAGVADRPQEMLYIKFSYLANYSGKKIWAKFGKKWHSLEVYVFTQTNMIF